MDRYDYNFAHSIAVFAMTGKTGEVTETRDVLLTNSRAPIAEFNQGLFKAPAYKLERTLDRVQEYQARVRLPLRLHLPSEHESVASTLTARGYAQGDPVPAMALAPIEGLTVEADGLDIVRANDDKTLRDFADTAFTSFGYPVELAPVALTEALMGLPHVELFVGYDEGVAVACSMVLITGDVAGIYWVGVRESHRRRGLGAALTAKAVLAGKARGCSVASLQASPLGAPVYERMGFSVVRRYLRFDLPVS